MPPSAFSRSSSERSRSTGCSVTDGNVGDAGFWQPAVMRFLFALFLFLAAPAAFALGSIVDARFVANAMKRGAIVWDMRSEEHTSELQSRLHLVCRLLLEKKKKKKKTTITLHNICD